MRAIWVMLLSSLATPILAGDWLKSLHDAFKQHQSEADGQTVIVFIESADTSIFLKFGPEADRYNGETFFKVGGLVPLRQAYYAVAAEQQRKNFLEIPVRENVSIQKILTHRSGYPRYPWYLEQCNHHMLDTFLNRYTLPEKAPFQISFVGVTLLENWMRSNLADYPEWVKMMWGFDLISVVPFEDKANANIIRQPSPIDCWSYCMVCPDQSAYIRAHQIRQLIRNIVQEKDQTWLSMASPKGKTPIPQLHAGLGFQIATKPRKLPMAMHYTTDAGNTLFIGWTAATKTAIAVLADSDQAVDNLGIRLMSSFHRDILNFHP
jgi:hypothetical protein